MNEHLFIGLASIVVLGILAQWLAWRLHLPAILLLLVFGFIAGPASHILNPDELFGELLFPFVSLSVAIILFEGGLSLHTRELVKVGSIVRNLTTLGIAVTWLLTSATAHFVIGLEFGPSFLLGAILVVSGPTVIIPLLRQVRPIGNIGSILKWEGIVNDPIGAILAVIVFEIIVSGSAESGTLVVVLGAAKAAVFGTISGILGALAIVILLKKFLIPDFLQNPVSLMFVILSYVAANQFQPESGLLAVTVMGVVLANQKYVSIRHIIEFKENLRVLLISSVFIILASRIPLTQMSFDDHRTWIFVGLLIFLIRPIMVYISTIRSKLKFHEKTFLAWMAPRGIVAAAVSSVFANRLVELGHPEYQKLVPLTFLVIIATVTVYGLTSGPIARRLKVAQADPQGILFAGAPPWAMEIASILQEKGFQVAMIDTNWSNIAAAKKNGIRAHYANILSENLHVDLQLDGIGRLLAVTPNDEVNSLAVLHFLDVFGRSGVYQLKTSVDEKNKNVQESMPRHMLGRFLFGKEATFNRLNAIYYTDGIVKRTLLTEEYDFKAFRKMYGITAIPMFIINKAGRLQILTADDEVDPKPGDTLISMVEPIEQHR
nr:cation:proton antiporter [candidate division Zixibacteria bacterium]